MPLHKSGSPLLMVTLALLAQAGGVEGSYKQVRGKIVVMRQPLDGEHLIFNAEGTPIGTYAPGHIATDAGLRVTKIEPKNGKLLIEGNRVTFQGSTAKSLDTDRKLRIEAELNDTSESAIGDFFTRAFLPPQETDRQLKDYVTLLEGDAYQQAKNAGKAVGSFRDGRAIYAVEPGLVEAPKAVYSPDPLMRPGHTRRQVTLMIVVNERGHPEDLRISRAAGEGMDAVAIQTVARWRFSPAKKDGSPVPVAINVEINWDF